MKLTKHYKSDKWRVQIAEAFAEVRTPAANDALYKKLFRYYYITKFGAPDFRKKEHKDWSDVYWYLSEQNRRTHARLAGFKESM